MRNYKVNVNGVNYEVAVEEITGAAAPVQAAPVQVAQSAPVGGETIVAPMPGAILAVNVKVGSVVKSGDVLMVLEAMKMENEIMAPVNGTIKSVNTTVGANVNTGDVLLTIG